MATRSSPPTLPLRNFETNANRVRALIREVHPAVPPRSRLQSDVAAAVIVMTISAVDTYFGDRYADDFEQKFHTLDEEALGSILAAVFQIGNDGFERKKFARALQHSEPKDSECATSGATSTTGGAVCTRRASNPSHDSRTGRTVVMRSRT